MTRLEKLEQEIYDAGIEVIDCPSGHPALRGERSLARVSGGRLRIYIDRRLPSRLRYCTLAHEFGHFQTGFGGLGISCAARARSEALAWNWAIEHILPIGLLMGALRRHRNNGCIDLNAAADDAEVPLWFLDKAMAYYYDMRDNENLRGGKTYAR